MEHIPINLKTKNNLLWSVQPEQIAMPTTAIAQHSERTLQRCYASADGKHKYWWRRAMIHDLPSITNTIFPTLSQEECTPLAWTLLSNSSARPTTCKATNIICVTERNLNVQAAAIKYNLFKFLSTDVRVFANANISKSARISVPRIKNIHITQWSFHIGKDGGSECEYYQPIQSKS